MVSVADRLAAEGFVVLAPDLYGGRITHDEEEAVRWMRQLPPADAVNDLAGSVDYLLSQPFVDGNSVGVVGFCMGGGFVLRLAARAGEKVSAAVVFYGAVNPSEDLSGIRAAVQGHFGELDGSIPPQRAREEMNQIRAEAGVSAEAFFYKAGHAFFNELDLLGTYDEDSADLAWNRTLGFLRSRLADS
jgi:carboxymethylenebutenolidase